MKPKKLGIYLYNRLFDPLIQSNFWLYINDYLEDTGEYKFYIITYEDARFPLTKEQKVLVKEWQEKGLVWIPLAWNPGTSIFSKMKDLFQGFITVIKLRINGCKHFVSLASVAASFLYLYHLILRFNYFLYQYEPHSEYAIDNKMWSINSLQYKITHFLERKAANKATVISSGTKFMEQRLIENWKVKANFFKIPSVANSEKFSPSEESRTRMRKRLGFSESTKVIFYPGKFGDLYYREEIAFMFKWILEEDDNFHFLIVTPQNDEEIISLFKSADVAASNFTIEHSDYVDIHHYFAAADFGVIAVPPGPSKKFISNIKVGEYLTAGLPFLITEGISEDYIYATEKKVGVVVKDFKKEYIKKAVPSIQKYLNQDRNELRIHCRGIGLDYRGFENLNEIFKKALSSLFCEN